jgi:phosphonate transport system substrate-binding protein
VFAPRNRAFVDLGDQLALLAEDPEALAAVLNYHVIEGEALTSEDLAAGDPLVTLQGEEVTVAVDADVVTFNDGQATAVCGDIPLANGTLFILDAALVPESVATAISVPPTTEAAAETSAPADGATGSTEPTASSAPGDSTGTTEAGGAPSGVAFPVTPGPDWPESLTFTLTPSSEAGGLIATAEPLAALLEERLGLPVEALVPTDYAGVIVALQSGQAHVAGGLGPVQMVQAEDEAGADLILQSERFGSFEYVTQWFTNDPATFCADEPVANEDGLLFCNGVLDATSAADGPIGEEHLVDVAGKTVAFVDQGSASGYLVPALQLLNQGVDPVEDITSQFAGTHDATVQAVYDGDADVGVSFNDARTGLVEQFPDVGEQVVVFAWSFPIPNDGFAVAGDLPDDLKQAITDAFVDISSSEEGTALLQELYEIDGLQPVNSADYDVIRELNTELADLLE